MLRKAVLAPQTAPYLIESAGRPVRLFRLPPALAAADADSSSRCHQGRPEGPGGVPVVCTRVMCFGVSRKRG